MFSDSRLRDQFGTRLSGPELVELRIMNDIAESLRRIADCMCAGRDERELDCSPGEDIAKLAAASSD